MKFKIKGASRYESIENLCFYGIGLGVLLLILGFSLSVNTGDILAGSAAIAGSFLFFVSLVALIINLFLKEIKSPVSTQS